MYLAWSLGHVGIGLLTRSAWILTGSVLASAAVDREVAAEETALAAAFGAEYDEYRAEVPRYLPHFVSRR
jgi:protein-S-isoprenylcysteine O-methyltransferase Ste14